MNLNKTFPLFAVLLFLLSGLSGAFAMAQNAESITTIIIFRHAEKEPGTADPGLSPEGLKRADKLASMFGEEKISAIYSTAYQRTEKTVQPLAQALGLKVNHYSPVDEDEFQAILDRHTGEKIVICAHSNTVPLLLNYFTQGENFAALQENEYDKIFIVSKSTTGTSSTLQIALEL